jgi:hypothetical protein
VVGGRIIHAMTRRLALIAFVLILAACHSSTNYTTATGIKVHWQQNVAGSLERRVDVIVPAQYASSAMMQAVNTAVVQANRSPFIHMTIDVPNVAPASCPDRHCIIVTRAQLAYPTLAVTGTGWNADGHMYGIASRVRIDSDPIPQAVFNNVGCHEIAGHGDGLDHSTDGTQGPCQSAVLTTVDLDNIAAAHRHPDALFGGGLEAAAAESVKQKPLVWKWERHTYADYGLVAP